VLWINLATDVADLSDSMTLKWQQNKKSNQFKLCSKVTWGDKKRHKPPSVAEAPLEKEIKKSR